MNSSEDFLFTYTLRVAHVFGAIIWLGGVLFMGGAAAPIVRYYASEEHRDERAWEIVSAMERRLVGINWLALFALFISGMMLSAISRSFHWFDFGSRFEWAIHMKALLFIPVAIVNYLLSASHKELAAIADVGIRETGQRRVLLLRRANVWLSFALILSVALM